MYFSADCRFFTGATLKMPGLAIFVPTRHHTENDREVLGKTQHRGPLRPNYEDILSLLHLSFEQAAFDSTMKTAATLVAFLGAANAFAPSSQSSRSSSSLAAIAELEGMVGVDLETGKRIVSTFHRDSAVL